MANRHYHFKFNVEKDATYIKRLDAQPNMQNYIRRLILSDIAADELKDAFKLYVEYRYGGNKRIYKQEIWRPDPEPEENKPDAGAIEFKRRADLMARYCHGAIEDNDPDYCNSCIWSYHPDNYSDTIRCKFDGLTADEMEELIKNWHDHINEVVRNGSEQV